MAAAQQKLDSSSSPRPLVVFSLDGQRYALDLPQVQRSIRVVALTPLPSAPELVLGAIDLAGAVLPVIDLRRRFGHPPRALRLTDQLVIASTGRRAVALLVDQTHGVLQGRADEMVPAAGICPQLGAVEGALTLADGLVLIHDLGRLLSLEEDEAVARALRLSASPAAAHGGA